MYVYLRLLCLFALTAFLIGAEPVNIQCNFEDQSQDEMHWRVWGVRNVSADDIKKIITYTTDHAFTGSKSLMVRDSLEALNPYAFSKPIAVDAGHTYNLTGHMRSEELRDVSMQIRVMALHKSDDIRWIVSKDIPATAKWEHFNIQLQDLPAETTHICIAVVPLSHASAGQQKKGAAYVDAVRLYEDRLRPLDLSKQMNRPFADDQADDGLGGWTDQGDNDMRNLKPRPITVGGLQFTVVNPVENQQKSVVAFKSRSKGFAEKAQCPVNEKADWLYLLHAGAWLKNGKELASVRFNYEDKSYETVSLKAGVDVGDWWNGDASSALSVSLKDVNTKKSVVYLFATAVANPKPGQRIRNIEFEMKATGKAMWMLCAANIGVGANSLDAAKVSDRDRSKWFSFAMNPKKTAKPMIDMSYLLDAPAGKHGFLSVKDGQFYFPNNKRARFFGTNLHSHKALFPNAYQAEQAAETLARNGVSLLRFHLTESMTINRDLNHTRGLVGEDKLRKFDYFVKCLKDKGIYILIDSVTGLSSRKMKAGDGVEGYKVYSSHRPWAYYEPKLIELGKTYMDTFLTRKNYYTKKSLLEEPAVVMLMLINEQTMFFDWREERLGTPDYYKNLIRHMFNKWLTEKYKTQEALVKAWIAEDGKSAIGAVDILSTGSVRLPTLEELQEGKSEWCAQRVRDATAFLKDVQASYYREMKKHLLSLGCNVPISGTNIILSPASLETQLELDFTSQNCYYDLSREKYIDGKTQMFCQNVPAVDVDPLGKARLLAVPIAGVKVNSHPVTSTESDMMWPHEWRSGYFLSLASSAALQDWDAIMHYTYMGGWDYDWDTADTASKILDSTVDFNDPAIMGFYPMASLLFHRGDVARAKNKIQVVYSEKEKLDAKATISGQNFPFNYLTFVSRVESVFAKPDADADALIGTNLKGALMPLRQEGKSQRLMAMELDAVLKKKQIVDSDFGLGEGKIVSDTGEIVRDWRNSLMLVNTDKTQGFSGFPNKAVALQDLTILTKNDYCTIVVSSLDNKKISVSNKILITSVARAENSEDIVKYGEFTQTNSGAHIGLRPNLIKGKAGEVLVEPVVAELKISARSARVFALNPDMSARRFEPVVFNQAAEADGMLTIRIGHTDPSVWYVVEIDR